MKQRIQAILLTVCMLITMMPMTAFAAENDTVLLNGVEMAEGVTAVGGGTITVDRTENKITMENVQLTSSEGSEGGSVIDIFPSSAYTFVVKGNNSISIVNNSSAIFCQKALAFEFEENAKLSVSSADGVSEMGCITSNRDLTFNMGEGSVLTASSGNKAVEYNIPEPISCYGKLEINGGTFNLTSPANGYALYSDGEMVIQNGAKVTARADNFYAVATNTGLKVTGEGTSLKATAGSHAVYITGPIVINDGAEVNAESARGQAIYSEGNFSVVNGNLVFDNGPITISGDNTKVTATAGRKAIRALNDLSITGGAIVKAQTTGEEVVLYSDKGNIELMGEVETSAPVGGRAAFSPNGTVNIAAGYNDKNGAVLDSGNKYFLTGGNFTTNLALTAEAQLIDTASGAVKARGALGDMITAAANGDTVKVCADITLAGTKWIQKTLTLDLNGHTISSSTDTIGAAGSASNLTITDTSSAKTGKIISSGANCGAVWVYGGKAVLENGTLQSTHVTATRSVAVYVTGGGKMTVSGGSITGAYGLSVQGAGSTLIMNAGTINGTTYAAVLGSGTSHDTVIEINGGTVSCPEGLGIYHPQRGTLTINDGTITGGTGIGIKSGTLNIYGGTINAVRTVYYEPTPSGNGVSNDGSGVLVDSYIGYEGSMNISISGGAVINSANGYAVREIGNDAGQTNVVTLSITDGYLKSASDKANVLVRDVTKGNVSITGGYFTTDPTEYLGAGEGGRELVAVPSDKIGYSYMVGEKAASAVDAKPATGETEVSSDGLNADPAVKDSVVEASSSIDVTGLDAYANLEASNVTQTQSVSAKDKLKNDVAQNPADYPSDVHTDITNDANIYVYTQVYLDVEPVEYDNTSSSTAVFNVDITPMVRIVASTANTADGIKLENTSGGAVAKNAVILSDSEQKLDVTSTVNVRIPLPTDFAQVGDVVFVKHVKSDSEAYIYKCIVSGTEGVLEYVEFVNTNGFSNFLVVKTFDTVASITRGGSTMYFESLQAAVDEVTNGETILIEADDVTQSAVVAKDISFVVDTNGKVGFGDNITAGTHTTMTKSVAGNRITYSFDYRKPSNKTNKNDTTEPIATPVTFKDVKKGKYYYDAVSWAIENEITEGTSDTTFSPNKVCTRAEALTFLWRAAGRPTPKTNVTAFTDIKEGAYYYEAVLWAIENGITKGTSDTAFSPNEECTRAHIVSFMYRAEVAGAIDADNPFMDVNANKYYYDAVLWALENGITNGTSETTFGPNGDCTRGQIVTFLYRQAN